MNFDERFSPRVDGVIYGVPPLMSLIREKKTDGREDSSEVLLSL